MKRIFIAMLGTALLGVLALYGHQASAQTSEQATGSTGLQGTISAPPPKTGARITVPGNGQTFTDVPITVRGTCPSGLLVKLFKNNVFSGSTQCQNGSWSIITDLFIGKNELVARVFDDLNQSGPDSNKVTVTYNPPGEKVGSRPTLTSAYAKRGANPGEKLTWPIVISGGQAPYAISVDWGDGTEPDLISIPSPGPFEISHKYASPGIYNILIKATDKNGLDAYLQLVGIGNGELTQKSGQGEDEGGAGETRITRIILWQPAAFLLPLLVMAFWFGRRNQMKELRSRISRGERPF